MLRRKRAEVMLMVEAFLAKDLICYWRCEEKSERVQYNERAEREGMQRVLDKLEGKRIVTNATQVGGQQQNNKEEEEKEKDKKEKEEEQKEVQLLTVEEMVEEWMKEAQDLTNLCAMYVGWCPFW